MGSGGKALVDLKGAPRVFLSSNTFSANGDSTDELLNEISPLVSNNEGEKFMRVFEALTLSRTQIINSYSEKLSLLMTSLIQIERVAQIKCTQNEFEYNWMFEPADTTDRSQLFLFKNFYGSLIIDGLTVSNNLGYKSLLS